MKHSRPDYDRIQDPAGKIPADEPVFLLRAQDKFAAKVAEYYADLVQAERLATRDDRLAEVESSIRAHAVTMAAWPRKKTPDL